MGTANVKITAKASSVPFSLAIFGFGLLKCGSNAFVYSPMSTVGCSLNVNFHGLLGDGSPTRTSNIMAKIRIAIAVTTSLMIFVTCYPLFGFYVFSYYINYGCSLPLTL